MLVEGVDYAVTGVDYDSEFRQLLHDTYDISSSGRYGADAWLWDYLDALFDEAARCDGILVIDNQIHDAKRYCEFLGVSPPPLYEYAFDACEGFLTASKIWRVHRAQWLARHPDPLTGGSFPERLSTFLDDEAGRNKRDTLDRLRNLWKGDHVLRRVLMGQTSVSFAASCPLVDLLGCDLQQMTCTGGDSGRDFPRICERVLQPLAPDEPSDKGVAKQLIRAVFNQHEDCMLYRLADIQRTHHVFVINDRWQIRVKVALEPSEVQDFRGHVLRGPPSHDSKVEVAVTDLATLAVDIRDRD